MHSDSTEIVYAPRGMAILADMMEKGSAVQQSVWRNWTLIVAFLALLVIVFWLVFDRPLVQTLVSAVGGLFIGIAMVWWRGRRTGARR
jgi:hypothetical protein